MADDRRRSDDRTALLETDGPSAETPRAREATTAAGRDAMLETGTGGATTGTTTGGTAAPAPAAAVDTTSIRAELLVSARATPPDAALIGQRLARAVRAERDAVRADTSLMADLRTALSPVQYLEALDLLQSPLRERLETALVAKSGDALYRYLIDAAFNAPSTEQQVVRDDATFMATLRRPLSRDQVARVLECLGASLEQRLQFAFERRNADNAYLARLLAQATPEERERARSDPAIRARLETELGGTAGLERAANADPTEVARTIQYGNPGGALDLLTYPYGETTARCDRFDGGRPSTVSLLGNLPRGRAMPADVRDDVDTIIRFDSTLTRVKKAFEVRWDASTRRERGPRSREDRTEVDAPAWSVEVLRAMHEFLIDCPDLQATGQVPAYVLHGTYQGGAFSPSTREIYVGGGVRIGDTVSGDLHQYGDADLAGTPAGPRDVSLLGAVVRHEIGHAVDDRMGSQSDGLKVGLGGFWSGTDFDQWMEGRDGFAVSRPSPGLAIPVSDADKRAIKTHLRAYMNGDGKGQLRAGLADDHAVVRYYDAGLPILEAFKGCEGQGKRFWTAPGRLYENGGKVFSVNAHYHFLQSCNASVRDNIMRPYQLFSHMEFFAEMYSVFYEDGASPDANPGQRVPVGSWRAWFQQNVHGPGMAPESMRGRRPRSGAGGGGAH